MGKLSLVKGTTSYRAYVFIQDSSVSTGAGLTGLAFNTASLVASYVRPGAARTAITLATQTATGAYSSGGFVEVDATNTPGLYRLDVPDAALASGVNAVVIMLKGAANMAPCVFEIELTGVDNQDAAAFGLSRLDAAISSRSTYAGGAVASVTGSVGSIATGGIAAASFAAGAIDATAIATDAIGSAEISAAAVTKIQSGLSTYAGGDTSGTTTLLSRLSSARAGYLDNLSAGAVALASSILDAAGVRGAVGLASANLDTQLTAIDDYIDTEVAAIKAKTDNLPASPAAVGSAMTLTSGERDSIATALLKLDWTGITGEAGRSMLNALRFLRNKWSVSGATLTVTKEDDTISAWTATLTTNASADPVTGSDPA